MMYYLTYRIPCHGRNSELNPGAEAWFDLDSCMLSLFKFKKCSLFNSHNTAIHTTSSTIENVAAVPENDSNMKDSYYVRSEERRVGKECSS